MSPATAAVREVFDHWRQVMGHQRAVLDGPRSARIAARLKSYSVADLKAAIDGCKLSPWNQGANPDGRTYDEIGMICRDAEHVERYMAVATKPPSPVYVPPQRPRDPRRGPLPCPPPEAFEGPVRDLLAERLKREDAAAEARRKGATR